MIKLRNILKRVAISIANIPIEGVLLTAFLSFIIIVVSSVGSGVQESFNKVETASVSLPLKKAFAARNVELPPQFKSVTCAFKYLICRVRDTSNVMRDYDTRYFSSENGSAFLQSISAYSADFTFELSVSTGEIRSLIQHPEKLSVDEAAESMEHVIRLLALQRDEEIIVKEKEKSNVQSWELNPLKAEK